MKLQLQPQLIQPAMKEACLVIDRLLQAGFSAFFVGGAVRDTMLGRDIHDVDIATSALPQQVMALFEKSIPTGLQHGTVTVIVEGQSYEITTFRIETGYVDFRRPGDVQFVSELNRDLMRRDFTMNAMAIDRDWMLHDPFDGWSHLRSGILVTVGTSSERFQEDALRMLRAIRFAASYQLTIERQCWEAIIHYGHLLNHVAMERVAYELERMLNSDFPARGITLLLESGLLSHTKEKLNLASGHFHQNWLTDKKDDASMKWAALFICLGMSSECALEDMRKLRLSNKLIQTSSGILQLYECVHIYIGSEQSHEGLKERWLDILLQFPLDQTRLFLRLLEQHDERVAMLAAYDEALSIHSMKQLAVRGNDLLKWYSKPSGPWVKQALAFLFKRVASGTLTNDKKAIHSFVTNQIEGGLSNEQ